MFLNKTLEFGYKHRLGTQFTPIRQTFLDVEEELDIKSYDFRQENEIAKNRKVRDQGNYAKIRAIEREIRIELEDTERKRKRLNEDSS